MTIYCQNCGIIIYWDDDFKEPVTDVDDMSCPPYVTAQGDLFCSRCGPKYDEEEDEAYDEKYDEFYGITEEKTAKEVVDNTRLKFEVKP